MNIVAEFIYPPIASRSMDWRAIDTDNYDADCDELGYFSHSPVGYGATREEAIADLERQLLEDAEDDPDFEALIESACEHGVAPSETCPICDGVTP